MKYTHFDDILPNHRIDFVMLFWPHVGLYANYRPQFDEQTMAN